ncbi:MAG TPA: hypothetical protein VJJ81_01235 [Candidatus Babeliales bacterium]|nr:hypothetical protein [Candidatus Babeliales bacterium]
MQTFIGGMAEACMKVVQQMQAAAHRQAGDRSELLRQLNLQQRQLLTLFQQAEVVTNAQIAG